MLYSILLIFLAVGRHAMHELLLVLFRRAEREQFATISRSIMDVENAAYIYEKFLFHLGNAST